MEVNRVNLSISTGLFHRQVSTGQRSANGLKDLNLKLADHVEKNGSPIIVVRVLGPTGV